MPLVSIGLVTAFVIATFAIFINNNNGVEFFVESETEQAIVFVRGRGNLSLEEKDQLTKQVEKILLSVNKVSRSSSIFGKDSQNFDISASRPIGRS